MSGLFAMTAGAQTPATDCTKADGPQTECAKPDCDKRPNAMAVAFEGIELTQEQQAALNKINQECKTKCDARRAADEAEKNAKKDEECKARMQEHQQAVRDYLGQVQKVLTPEQYVQYLENFIVKNIPFGNGDKPKMPGRRGHHGHHGPQGPQGPQGCPGHPDK